MDCATRRRLQLVSHTSRRDSRGHMVVSLRFLNASEEPYRARVRVAFRDAAGTLEPGADAVDQHRFPPGQSMLEWTSYRPEASGYVVRVEGAGLLPW
jgi:hypothetical protein